MRRHTAVITQNAYAAADVFAATVAIALAFAAVNGTLPSGLEAFLSARVTVANVFLGALFVAVRQSSFHLFRVYKPNAATLGELLKRLILASSAASAVLALLPEIYVDMTSRWRSTACFWAASILAAIAVRAAHHTARALAARHPTQVLIVGSGPRALRLYRELQEGHLQRYRVVGFVDNPNAHMVPPEIRPRMLGSIDHLDRILMSRVVDNVMIALPMKSCYDEIQRTIAVCEKTGVESQYLPDSFRLSLARSEFPSVETRPVVRLKVVDDDCRLVIKRVLDIAGSAFGLILLAPILGIIALAIKLSSPGPVFFAQERYGLAKRRFKMYKFRTMVPNAETLLASLEDKNEKMGPIFKMKLDPRVTPVGRILRITSADELPQLWNVLIGEMSLVGPRPMSVRDVSRFDEPWLMRRFSVKPGLTCLWQISGRSNTSFTEWMSLDMRYIDTWSLSLDLAILFRTIPAVICGQGAV